MSHSTYQQSNLAQLERGQGRGWLPCPQMLGQASSSLHRATSCVQELHNSSGRGQELMTHICMLQSKQVGALTALCSIQTAGSTLQLWVVQEVCTIVKHKSSSSLLCHCDLRTRTHAAESSIHAQHVMQSRASLACIGRVEDGQECLAGKKYTQAGANVIDWPWRV